MDGGVGYSSDEDSLASDDGRGEVFPPPARTRADQAELLCTWMKIHAPRDVLMPAPLGEKRPAHAHAAGAWTWARYDFVSPNVLRGRKDVGLLLHDLCVVDVDTVAAADALEAAFPELTDVPMERTARGRHYYLARSPLADAHGFYDGAAQRAPGVDFKTRLWGGGSGFVVTAPSTNKVRGVRCDAAIRSATKSGRRLAMRFGRRGFARAADAARALPTRIGRAFRAADVGARALGPLPARRPASHLGRAAARGGGAAPRAAPRLASLSVCWRRRAPGGARLALPGRLQLHHGHAAGHGQRRRAAGAGGCARRIARRRVADSSAERRR
jgi:hypothetical protein